MSRTTDEAALDAVIPTAERPEAPIPLVDLKVQHATVAETIQREWARVVDAGAFVLGHELLAFEEAYARFCGRRHCVGVANGTDAIELALRAADIGPGDEVIVPTNSFIASASAIVRAGATPTFVDVDPTFHLIDPEHVAARVTPRTAAILAVHLFGQMAPIEKLREATGARVLVFEDAAQAHGAKRHGVAAGGLGIAGATSFYPGKNLGAYGDAGAVIADEDDLARKVRSLRDHGSEAKYRHPELGFNSRLDTLQAVVLGAKLPFLEGWNQARRMAAGRYDELLMDLSDVVRPSVMTGNEHVWHQYVVQVPRRDIVLQRLHEAGIGAGIHYPIPIHLQGAFAHLEYRQGEFPVAERLSKSILSLPIFPGITPQQQERVADELTRALR